MDHDILQRIIKTLEHYANDHGEVLVVDDFYDSYAIRYTDGKFILINFSPRENAVYNTEEISPETAWEYLQKLRPWS